MVYNTFPFPNLDDNVKRELHNSALKILKARALFEDWSMAELYDDLIMPPELRRAHQDNDRVVMKAYNMPIGDTTENDSVAVLFNRYKDLVKNSEV